MSVEVELLGRTQRHICPTSTVLFDLMDRIFQFVYLT